jgi:crossover junction endodeoxyribonuclease RuvC
MGQPGAAMDSNVGFSSQFSGQLKIEDCKLKTDAQPARYLGIDPGLCRTGYAVLERSPRGPVLCEGGVIRSTPRMSLAERVLEIGQGIREIFEQFQPTVMAIEQVFSTVQYPKTALLMAHARGAILFAAAERHALVVHYTPRQIKRLLTGSGKAGKDQVQHAIRNELHLAQLLEPNDVADAAAVALCHYYMSQVALPAS